MFKSDFSDVVFFENEYERDFWDEFYEFALKMEAMALSDHYHFIGYSSRGLIRPGHRNYDEVQSIMLEYAKAIFGYHAELNQRILNNIVNNNLEPSMAIVLTPTPNDINKIIRTCVNELYVLTRNIDDMSTRDRALLSMIEHNISKDYWWIDRREESNNEKLIHVAEGSEYIAYKNGTIYQVAWDVDMSEFVEYDEDADTYTSKTDGIVYHKTALTYYGTDGVEYPLMSDGDDFYEIYANEVVNIGRLTDDEIGEWFANR